SGGLTARATIVGALEAAGALADLAGRQVRRLRDERVGALRVPHTPGHVEGPARRLRHAPTAEEHVAVVAHDDLPGVTRHVLVDLEFGLDLAVVGRQLELPGAAVAARPGSAHLALLRGGHARRAEHF